jgi:hypothetical protein
MRSNPISISDEWERNISNNSLAAHACGQKCRFLWIKGGVSGSGAPMCAPTTHDPSAPMCAPTTHDPSAPMCGPTTHDLSAPMCGPTTHDLSAPMCAPTTHDPSAPTCAPTTHDPSAPMCAPTTHDPSAPTCAPTTHDPSAPTCASLFKHKVCAHTSPKMVLFAKIPVSDVKNQLHLINDKVAGVNDTSSAAIVSI